MPQANTEIPSLRRDYQVYKNLKNILLTDSNGFTIR